MKFSFRAVGHWSKGILTLRELREEDEGKGVEPHYGFENYANKETDTKYQRGSGEAHVYFPGRKVKFPVFHVCLASSFPFPLSLCRVGTLRKGNKPKSFASVGLGHGSSDIETKEGREQGNRHHHTK